MVTMLGKPKPVHGFKDNFAPTSDGDGQDTRGLGTASRNDEEFYRHRWEEQMEIKCLERQVFGTAES